MKTFRKEQPYPISVLINHQKTFYFRAIRLERDKNFDWNDVELILFTFLKDMLTKFTQSDHNFRVYLENFTILSDQDQNMEKNR